MTPELKNLAVQILDTYRLLTIATLRPDGWPQATIVRFVNNGLNVYIVVTRDSQKYANVSRDARVSLTVGSEIRNPMTMTALSIAARCIEVIDDSEHVKVMAVLRRRYPEYAAIPESEPADRAIFHVTPEIMSILDYSKGFGHRDVVRVTAQDLRR